VNTISTLGPEGTFSDLGAKSYLHAFGEVLGIEGNEYFKSIKSTERVKEALPLNGANGVLVV
jgi:hypothetical protein